MFKYYAHRVKGLKVESDDLDPPIIRALHSSRSCLFPKLRYLWWNDFKYESLPALKPFAGPALKILRLSLSPWPGKDSDSGEDSESEGPNSEDDNASEERESEKIRKSLRDIFSYVGQASHNLEELSLVDDYEESFPGCGEQSSLILSAMPLVPCVVLWNELSNETLSSLSKMPNLRSLACHYYYSPYDCDDTYSVWEALTLGEQTLEFSALGI
ncbi:hypothetical protein EWM64_g4449 [Hericium alpestre]|uniref:F-box domain-containing protein n=1 Tax=Hericium alpestre TaxID=135208 RepID=A0A4Y9ZXP1_9AGAM|nr:hypothetical protein EWM64_g4449 [Hericium alpestre]